MAYTTINKSTDYFNTKLYTGNGSTNAITGVGFQPDFTWIKQRAGSTSHMLFDVIRGATYRLSSDTTEANGQYSTSLTAFGSDGFTLGSFNDVNINSGTFAAWNWKANGLGSSNTDGSINTTYTSANTTSGFSIIQYTGNATAGATIGHGLGKVPKMIIFRRYAQAENWGVYFSALGNTKSLNLNLTGAEATDANFLNSTTPTSSLITLGTSVLSNASNPMIAYAFAEIPGFSKFGSYKGLGGSGEPFIYTGFKPAFIITRNITSAVNWGMFDDKRNPFNVVQNVLLPDNSASETTGTAKYFDFLSNGFKVKNDSLQYNGTNENHIYLAFAAAPLVGTNNVPANAR